MKILARANKKLRGNGKFYTIPEPAKSWFYVTKYDSNGYPIKAKTLNCSGAMPYTYMYGSYGAYKNIIPRFLREFEINEGVISISNYAFAICESLTSIIIPDGITSIGNNAFRGCISLKSISIPDGVTSIEDSAFHSCKSLKNITMPSGITRIESSAFYSAYGNCVFDFRKATQVPTLANTDAFYNTSTKKIVVPDSLYDSWITATNWSSTDYNIVTSIIKASDYEASL